MFRLIRIIFNAFILVLAIIGFNALGGDKYTEPIRIKIVDFIENYKLETSKKIGDFSKLNEEFQIDNSVNLMGYKAVIAEHKASGQKMVIIDSGKKPLLTQEEIKSSGVETKLKDLSKKFRYQGANAQDIKVTSRGQIQIYEKKVPYAKFEAHVNKFPLSDVAGIVASVKTSDDSEKLAISLSDKKKYSQLISNEFFKGVKENKK